MLTNRHPLFVELYSQLVPPLVCSSGSTTAVGGFLQKKSAREETSETVLPSVRGRRTSLGTTWDQKGQGSVSLSERAAEN